MFLLVYEFFVRRNIFVTTAWLQLSTFDRTKKKCKNIEWAKSKMPGFKAGYNYSITHKAVFTGYNSMKQR